MEEKGFREATIVVNGQELTVGESMTVRVALSLFANDISVNGLGDDAHGKVMKGAYLRNVRRIMELMK